MPVESLDFLVARADLRRTQWRTSPLPDLAPGEARLNIDRFALTANNVTYAAFGETMSYWNFFPAPEGFGRIPVWGFADVAATRCEGLSEGERIYGYFPMSSRLVVDVQRLTPSGFVDGAPHRAGLPAVYNHYQRVAADPAYAKPREAAQALLRPLFMTSFLIDDFLAGNGDFGASQVLISSASSKTSLGLAYVLKRAARPGLRTIGLTSQANAGFVTATGYYDEVAAYDAVPRLPIAPSVLVDMAGSAAIRAAVHARYGDALAYSCSVGGAHWEALGRGGGLPGPKPVLFFAPAQIKKRHADWGPGGLERRYAPAWDGFIASAQKWLAISEQRGRVGVEAAYREVLEGKARPEIGLIASVAD